MPSSILKLRLVGFPIHLLGLLVMPLPPGFVDIMDEKAAPA